MASEAKIVCWVFKRELQKQRQLPLLGQLALHIRLAYEINKKQINLDSHVFCNS